MKKRLVAFIVAVCLCPIVCLSAHAADSDGITWLDVAFNGSFQDGSGATYLEEFDWFSFFVSGAGQFIVNGKTGELVEYEEMYDFSDGLARVRCSTGYCFLDKTGAEVTPRFTYAEDFHDGLALVGKMIDGAFKFGFIDTSGNLMVDYIYDEARSFSEGMAVVGKAGTNGMEYGYIDTTGREVLPPQFTYASNFSEGLASVEGLWKTGVIDKSGQVVFYASNIGEFHDGMAVYSEIDHYGAYKWGYVNRDFEFVIPAQYDSASNFVDGIAVVMTGSIAEGAYGAIDKNGNEIIPIVYSNLNYYRNERFVTTEPYTGVMGVTDKQGNDIVPPAYRFYGGFSDGLIGFYTEDHHLGYMDENGNIVVEPMFFATTGYYPEYLDGVVGVHGNGTGCGFIDETGTVIVPLIYDRVFNTGGYLVVMSGSRVGYMKNPRYVPKKGYDGTVTWLEGKFSDELFRPSSSFALNYIEDMNWITYSDSIGEDTGIFDLGTGERLEFDAFDYAECGSEGLIRVWKHDKELHIYDKVGCIDSSGNIVVPIEFKFINEFCNGYALTDKGIIDKSGEIIFPGDFEGASSAHFSEDMLVMQDDNGTTYVFDSRTGQAHAVEADSVSPFQCGLGLVHIGGYEDSARYGYIGRDGELVVPAEYTSANMFREGAALVKKGEEILLIDTAGKVLEKPQYYAQDYEFSDDGLACITENGKYGYIDYKGNLVIPIERETNELLDRYGYGFQGGLAAFVSPEGLFGCIDTKGNIVIEAKYERYFSFPSTSSPLSYGSADYTSASRGGYRLIDKSGNEYPQEFKVVLSGETVLEEKDGKWGVCDLTGTELAAPVYDRYIQVNDSFMYFIHVPTYKVVEVPSSSGRYVAFKLGNRIGVYENPNYVEPKEDEQSSALTEDGISKLPWILMSVGGGALIVVAGVAFAIVASKKRKKHHSSAEDQHDHTGLCPKCGAAIAPGSKFCANCGESLK